MKTKTQISLPKKIFFSFISLLLIIILLETFFRIFPFHKDSGGTFSGFVVQDKELGWRLQPRKEGSLATNELGFRDTPFNQNADKRILLLGDSISWGDGIADVKKVYPYLLEQMLSEKTGHTYEVINSSVPGYSTFQQLRYLQLFGIDLDPDMIILQFCLNDVVERYSALSQYGGDNVFLGVDTRQSIPGIHGWLFKNSRAFEGITRLFMNFARNQQEYDVRKIASDQLSQELKSAWALTLSEIEGINKIAIEIDTPLMIVITPYRFQIGQPQKSNQPQKVLLKYGSDNDIPVVDLLPYLGSVDQQNSNIRLFNDANHFSIDGHTLTSQILGHSILSLFDEGFLEKNNNRTNHSN